MPNDSLPTAPSGEEQTGMTLTDEQRERCYEMGVAWIEAAFRDVGTSPDRYTSKLGRRMAHTALGLREVLSRLASLSTERARMERERDEAQEGSVAIASHLVDVRAEVSRLTSAIALAEKESTRQAMENARLTSELAEAKRPAMCSVCVGTGTPLSGKPCICGGVGTEQAEMHGLRVRCFELEDESARLTAEMDRVRGALEQYGQHKRGCWGRVNPGEASACNCGLVAALSTRREG